jgi:hypothetical protein
LGNPLDDDFRASDIQAGHRDHEIDPVIPGAHVNV